MRAAGPSDRAIDFPATSAEHVVEGCVQHVRMIERFSSQVLEKCTDPWWSEAALKTMCVLEALVASGEAGGAWFPCTLPKGIESD